MKRILFFAHVYWELHWMYNLIKSVNGTVYTDNDVTKSVCESWGIPTTDDLDNWDIVVMVHFHLGEQRKISEAFFSTGRQVILLQHAWDSALCQKSKFWGLDMTRFNYLLVGSKQDEEWLKPLHGDKVKLTGMPRLDDLYKVKHSKKSLDHIYKMVGFDKFLLAIPGVSGVHGINLERETLERLPGETPLPLVYKIHPGGGGGNLIAYIKERVPQSYCIDDDKFDQLKTYELIKASSGVVAVESFMLIEASLMGKPVVFYGRDQLIPDFYDREENFNQDKRLLPEMSSSIHNLVYTKAQDEVCSWYLFDGKNTKRTHDALLEIAKDSGQ